MPNTLSNFTLPSAITELKELQLAENVKRIREKVLLSGPKTEKIKKAKFFKIFCCYHKNMAKK